MEGSTLTEISITDITAPILFFFSRFIFSAASRLPINIEPIPPLDPKTLCIE